ncbi:hypothetical protein ALQ79_200680 [Pseudomonas amygdali pv. lachrymans]|nr:hypothetical protein ALQ79_200680 [Pseudomonas amygdali pv. lachrymans]
MTKAQRTNRKVLGSTHTNLRQNSHESTFDYRCLAIYGRGILVFTMPLLLADDSWGAGILAAVASLLSFKPFVEACWMD